MPWGKDLETMAMRPGQSDIGVVQTEHGKSYYGVTGREADITPQRVDICPTLAIVKGLL